MGFRVCAFVVVAATVVPSAASLLPAVPMCIAEKCGGEAKALATDSYTKDLVSCTHGFSGCGEGVWDCLGDKACRSLLQCGPSVAKKCNKDVWAMLTDPKEREKLMCFYNCTKDGDVDKWCVAKHCTVAAAACVFDKTCRDALNCLPEAMIECSGQAFNCVFGKDRTCWNNLECFNHAMGGCFAPGVNFLTDSKIGDFVTCAGNNCPHPASGPTTGAPLPVEVPADQAPTDPASQLLCINTMCGSKVLNILGDQDTKDLLGCALHGGDPTSVWSCLGNETCAQALSCWAKPLDVCAQDVWHVITDTTVRKKIVSGVKCMEECGAANRDDFGQQGLCVLQKCGEYLLQCSRDISCRAATTCLPKVADECTLPMLDSYDHDELFRSATNYVATTLEQCGRASVQMLRDPNIAEAVSCAARCTITPKTLSQSNSFVV